MQLAIEPQRYQTLGGIAVDRTAEVIDPDSAIAAIAAALDTRLGMVLASSYEVPGRYAPWALGFVDPPVAVTASARRFWIEALNERGEVIVAALGPAIAAVPALRVERASPRAIAGSVIDAGPPASEEERLRHPSLFSLVRAIADLFADPGDPHLGLYGAFGHDLALQIDPIAQHQPRSPAHRDLVLYLPDEIALVDHRRGRAIRVRYEFAAGGRSTHALPRTGRVQPLAAARDGVARRDHAPGEYAGVVRIAREAFRLGDLFEVNPSQTFREPCGEIPSRLFDALRARNPAPYGFLLNLGDGEHLIGASPEMYVRVTGRRVETCPIAGTVARGEDALGDASQIARLLASSKDEAELTMCTDVDRNDKARVCEPGSVRVIGRRQIEMYSRLIHTVDHVEGELRAGCDAIDALVAHAWAVTVTGAPKLAALQFIEDHERSPRAWYGAAIGAIRFDGGIDTGIALRTIRLVDGAAEVRVGATLLFDSDPSEEERETELKASALLAVLRGEGAAARAAISPRAASDGGDPRPGAGRRVLLVDHRDSFVHTLADYFRQTGADVRTVRAGFDHAVLDEERPDLVVLSPGPGTPRDFDVSGTLAALVARGIPGFGVCLGLQGMVEHFGGALDVLDEPVHGKQTWIEILGGRVFAGLPTAIQVGRYHSLFAPRGRLPTTLRVTAVTGDGVVMAVEHDQLPYSAVQFHPESILSLDQRAGARIVANVMRSLSGVAPCVSVARRASV